MFLVDAALSHRWAVQESSPRRVALLLARALSHIRGSRLILMLIALLCVFTSGAAVAYPLTGLTVGISVWALLRAWAYVRLTLLSLAQRPWRRGVAVSYVALAVWAVVGVPLWAGWAVAAVLVVDVVTRALSFRLASARSRVWSFGVMALFLCAAMCAVVWPDLAWVGIAYVFGLALLRTATWLVRFAFTPLPVTEEAPLRSSPLRTTTEPSAPWNLLPLGGHLLGTFTPRGIQAIAGGIAFVVVGVAMVAGTAVLTSANNTIDEFYAYDGELPAPGTLLRVGDFEGPYPEGLTVKRILFSSTDSVGEPTAASGFVAIPDTFINHSSQDQPQDDLPLVLWEHGTNGLESMCALSAGRGALDPQAFPAVDKFVGKQWAIVAPDFMTHGDPVRSPYLVGKGQAQFALDAVRAARTLSIADVASSADDTVDTDTATTPIDFTRETVVWGHSQGGNAALWTAQFADTYAPDIHIAGTAALSPAAMPLDLGLSLTSESASAAVGIVVSYVLGSYSAAYPDVHATDHVAHNALPVFAGYSSRCTNAAAAGSVLTALALNKQSNDVFINFEPETPLGVRLTENEPTGPFPSALFVGWGSHDEVINSTLQHEYVEKICGAGAHVEAHEYAGRTHMDVLHADSAMPDELVEWTQAVFAGHTTDATCQ